jgi:hypothetical protein
MLGSLIGSNLILSIEESVLRIVIGIITLSLLLFTILNPKLGLEKKIHKLKKRHYIIGLILAFLLGIYGGFYGACYGTFISYVLITLFGLTFLQSAATRKLSNLAMNIVAVTVFIINDVVNFKVGIFLFLGMFIGSYVAVHYSEQLGEKWIKRLFMFIVFIMAIKLFF